MPGDDVVVPRPSRAAWAGRHGRVISGAMGRHSHH